jgi:hypothetical protein
MKKERKKRRRRLFGAAFARSITDISNRDKKLLFWCLSPLIVPIFAQIYATMMTFMVGIVFYLIHRDAPAVLAIILLIVAIVCAIGTYIYLWKLFKKNFITEEKTEFPNLAL